MTLVKVNARTRIDTQVYSKEYLRGTDTSVDKFDGELFGKLINKVMRRNILIMMLNILTGEKVCDKIEHVQ